MEIMRVSVSNQQLRTTTTMPNYYHHEDYVSEKDMRGWNNDDKAEQREINWDIRLEYYAQRQNIKQFVKMLEKWYDDYEGRVPTLTMRGYVKIALRHFKDAHGLGDISIKIRRMFDEYARLNERYGWTD